MMMKLGPNTGADMRHIHHEPGREVEEIRSCW
jgi:hypothetical protein